MTDEVVLFTRYAVPALLLAAWVGYLWVFYVGPRRRYRRDP